MFNQSRNAKQTARKSTARPPRDITNIKGPNLKNNGRQATIIEVFKRQRDLLRNLASPSGTETTLSQISSKSSSSSQTLTQVSQVASPVPTEEQVIQLSSQDSDVQVVDVNNNFNQPPVTPEVPSRQDTRPQPSTSTGIRAGDLYLSSTTRRTSRTKRTPTRLERQQIAGRQGGATNLTQSKFQTGLGRGKGGIKRMKAVRRQQELEENMLAEERANEEAGRRTRRVIDDMRSFEYAYSRSSEPNLTIPRAPFMRLVRDILCRIDDCQVTRFQVAALSALKIASEDYLVAFFSRCALAVAHAKRVTLMPRDLILVKEMDRIGRVSSDQLNMLH